MGHWRAHQDLTVSGARRWWRAGQVVSQGPANDQLLSAVTGSCAVPANLILVPYPGAPAGAGDAYLKPSVFGSCLANGLPASEASALAVTQRPLSTAAFTQPSGVPAWKTIPSWAVPALLTAAGTGQHPSAPGDRPRR
jgi:hypothetical protein